MESGKVTGLEDVPDWLKETVRAAGMTNCADPADERVEANPGTRPIGRLSTAVAVLLLGACSALLPRSEILTDSPWSSFEDAQAAFDRIEVNKTAAADLKGLNLDPQSNPNITVLNYSDVLRRFIPSPSVDAKALDAGVRECIEAAAQCRGLEVDQKVRGIL